MRSGKIAGSMKLGDMQKLAVGLKITKSQNKPALVKAISQKLAANQTRAMEIMTATATSTFCKDENTVPRILNILSNHIGESLCSRVFASWRDLENRTTSHNGNPLFWAEVADKFNDTAFNSGGNIASSHPNATGLNPERPNTTGRIDADVAFWQFNVVKNDYAIAYKNWCQSGKYNDSDFWNFCSNRTDLLYMHYWFVKSGLEDFAVFCRQGVESAHGFESSTRTPAAPVAESSRSSSCPPLFL